MASATIKEVIEAAGGGKASWARPGCLILHREVKLRLKVDLNDDMKEGDVFYAESVDKNGKYPNTVHLKKMMYWWSVHEFEIVAE